MNKFATKFVALVPMKEHSVRVKNKKELSPILKDLTNFV